MSFHTVRTENLGVCWMPHDPSRFLQAKKFRQIQKGIRSPKVKIFKLYIYMWLVLNPTPTSCKTY